MQPLSCSTSQPVKRLVWMLSRAEGCAESGVDVIWSWRENQHHTYAEQSSILVIVLDESVLYGESRCRMFPYGTPPVVTSALFGNPWRQRHQ